MQQMVVLGDIHANAPALRAVLADIDARGLTNLYCHGDLVGYLPYPDDVIDDLRQRGVPTLMGNYDAAVGNDHDDCGCGYTDPHDLALAYQSVTWTRAHTRPDNKAWLRALPPTLSATLGGFNVRIVHGSPRQVNQCLFASDPDDRFERLLDEFGMDVLVCGHTHQFWQRALPSGRHVVNAGTVGKPADGDTRAGYVILTADSATLHVEIVRVAYDHQAVAAAIEASTLPDEFAAVIRHGGAQQQRPAEL